MDVFHARTCDTTCDTKTKANLLLPWIQWCGTGLLEGSVIFATLKAFLRMEFEGHICQNLGSLNSHVYVCVQGLRAGEERTAVGDLNQLPHWVFVDLFIFNNCLAQLACRDLCGAVLSALHSVKLTLRWGEQVRSCGLLSLLIIPLK